MTGFSTVRWYSTFFEMNLQREKTHTNKSLQLPVHLVMETVYCTYYSILHYTRHPSYVQHTLTRTHKTNLWSIMQSLALMTIQDEYVGATWYAHTDI